MLVWLCKYRLCIEFVITDYFRILSWPTALSLSLSPQRGGSASQMQPTWRGKHVLSCFLAPFNIEKRTPGYLTFLAPRDASPLWTKHSSCFLPRLAPALLLWHLPLSPLGSLLHLSPSPESLTSPLVCKEATLSLTLESPLWAAPVLSSPPVYHLALQTFRKWGMGWFSLLLLASVTLNQLTTMFCPIHSTDPALQSHEWPPNMKLHNLLGSGIVCCSLLRFADSWWHETSLFIFLLLCRHFFFL